MKKLIEEASAEFDKMELKETFPYLAVVPLFKFMTRWITKSYEAGAKESAGKIVKLIQEETRQQERSRLLEEIEKTLREFPLSNYNGVEFVMNEDNWRAGYAALDCVADYIKSKSAKVKS